MPCFSLKVINYRPLNLQFAKSSIGVYPFISIKHIILSLLQCLQSKKSQIMLDTTYNLVCKVFIIKQKQVTISKKRHQIYKQNDFST